MKVIKVFDPTREIDYFYALKNGDNYSFPYKYFSLALMDWADGKQLGQSLGNGWKTEEVPITQQSARNEELFWGRQLMAMKLVDKINNSKKGE